MAQDPICGMDVNEQEGIKLSFKGQDYYFCSPHCLEKFKKEHKVTEEKCPSCAVELKGQPWYKNKILQISLVYVLLLGLSFVAPILVPFRNALIMYFRTIWFAVLLGLVLGGVIDYFIPREYISKMLSKPRKRTILYSVVLGFLMSACSHGILALSIQLHKKGASGPAVVAFLLASPWANLPLTILLFGFFSWKAIFIVLSAVVIAVVTGLIFLFLESKGLIETNKNIVAVDEGFSIRADLKKRWSTRKIDAAHIKQSLRGIYAGSVSLGNMVLWWILLGMLLAALSGAYIPPNIFQTYLGPTLMGLLITLLVATVIEVCSEGSAPLSFEIYRQTGALGNSFVFLMAGVVTDYTEIGLIWQNVGRKTAIWLPIVTVPQVVLLGWVFNVIF